MLRKIDQVILDKKPQQTLQEYLNNQTKQPELPFELVIIRICEQFHKLPSQVLSEDWFWLRIIMKVMSADSEKQRKDANDYKLKSELGQRLNGRR